MNRMQSACLLLLVSWGLFACQSGDHDEEISAAAKTVQSESAPTTDKTAPINIEYEIMGIPVVGIPLSINVKISPALDRPIQLNYRINDSTSLKFSDAQSESVLLVQTGDKAYAAEQVTVVPQREGRLFLNVSAEIESDVGMIAKVLHLVRVEES